MSRPRTAHAQTADNAGLITTRRVRQTGNLVSLYRANDAGIEDDPTTPYALVCEDHAGVVCVETQDVGLGELPYPNDWCPTCQAIVELAAKEAEPAAADGTDVTLAERIAQLREFIADSTPTASA